MAFRSNPQDSTLLNYLKNIYFNIIAQTNLIRFLFSTQNQSFAMIYHWAAKVCFSVDTKCEMSTSNWIFWSIFYSVIHFLCLHIRCYLIWLPKIYSMRSVQQANSHRNLIVSMRKSQQVSWDYDNLWWKFINNVASLGFASFDFSGMRYIFIKRFYWNYVVPAAFKFGYFWP